MLSFAPKRKYPTRVAQTTRASWWLKLSEIILFIQQHIQNDKKKNSKGLRHWPVVKGIHRFLGVYNCKYHKVVGHCGDMSLDLSCWCIGGGVSWFPELPHDDVIKWKHFRLTGPLWGEFPQSPVNYAHKHQWRGALMYSLIYALTNGWANHRDACVGGLRHHRTHYDVTVM